MRDEFEMLIEKKILEYETTDPERAEALQDALDRLRAAERRLERMCLQDDLVDSRMKSYGL